MPHADFDAMQAARQQANSCTVLGQEYTNLPELPLAMGLDLMASGDMTPEEQRAVLTRIFDFVFGEGALLRFEEDPRFSSEYCGRLVAYIRYGYRMDILKQIEDAAEKNVPLMAQVMMQAEMQKAAASIYATTGQPSSQTLDASTESDSPQDEPTPTT